jgi:hypothetical protein
MMSWLVWFILALGCGAFGMAVLDVLTMGRDEE